MSALLAPLHFAQAHGRLLLVLGLAAGIALPGLAGAMRPYLQELVAALLFIAALRIGPRQAVGAIRDLPATAGLVVLYQTVMPLSAVAVAFLAGVSGHPLATALVLMLSAASISGSPNLTLMTGHDPAPALRLLVLGTAALPLTVLPVLWALPALGGAGEVLAAATRLFAVIVAAGGAAFLIRATVLRAPTAQEVRALDGLSAIAMAVVVVGLMSAVGPAIRETPERFLGWLAVACLANFGLQLAAAAILRRTPLSASTVPFSIVAGNRNIALFLVALPQSVTDPVLLFIGCYQIPMYLTPLVMAGAYRRLAA